MAVYSKFLSLINGVNRTVDLASNTLNVNALQIGGALLSGSTGSALIGDAGGYSNFTPTAATVRGALQGIDSALAGVTGSAITALTGDATASGPGSAVLTLATVNSNVGSFGDASDVATFTVNAKGLITAAGSISIQIAESQVTNLVSDLSAKLSNSLGQNHIFVGNSSGVATDVAMSGEASIVSSGAVTLSNAAVIAKVLTGYSAGSGTVSSSDSILSAIQKIDGNDALKLPLAGGTMSGNIAMGGNLITGLSAPSANGQALIFDQLGSANGVASLDSSGKIPVAQLPSTVMEYQGAWNPSTNSPSLADGTGANGNVYYVTAAYASAIPGLSDPSMVNFQVGDLVIYNGTKWQLVSPANGVSSVNGAQGAVTVNAINQLTGDVTAGPASGSQSVSSSIASIQGTSVSGTTGSGNVVFSNAPTFTGLLSGSSASFSSTISASNFSGSSSGTNTGDVTLGTANGLSLSGQALSLQLASGSQNGALSSTDWNTFNNKLTSSLTSAYIFVGNASNVASPVAVSGDLSLANTGAFTIANSAVTLAKMASNSVDENKIVSTAFSSTGAITGGSGSKIAVQVDNFSVEINVSNQLKVLNAPSNVNVMVAGQSFSANTSYIVRMALNGETAGQVYAADQDASSEDKFWGIGIAYSATAVSAGQNIDVIMLGQYSLQSSDSAFASGDIGKPVYLLSSGAFSTSAPTTANYAIFKIGNVMTTSSMIINSQLIGVN
jgi:hypothetical protein